MLGIGVILLFPRLLPYLVLLLAILIEQELYAGDTVNSVGPLVHLGSGFYYANAVGTLALVAVLSAAVVVRRAPSLLDKQTRVPALLASALALWVVLLAWFQGVPITSAVADSRHALTLLAGVLAAGVLADADQSAWPRFRLYLYWAVIIKAAIGVAVLLTGQGPSSSAGSAPVAFYDSLPLLIAAAAFAVSVLDVQTHVALRNAALMASLLLGAVSLRRASLAGAILVVLAVVVLSRRGAATTRVVALAAVIATIAITAFPGTADKTGTYISDAASGVISGHTSEASTSGHLRDNSTGLRLAEQHPWLGVGVEAAPTTQFVVVQGKLLYVHNEFLYAWLHYGFPGLLLLLAIVGYSVRQSLRVIGGARKSAPWSLFGAAILLGALPGYWFFPHLMTLDRFALLVGWSLGAVALRSSHEHAAAVSGGLHVLEGVKP